MVTTGRMVQSTTQRREAVLDTRRRRSFHPFHLSVLVLVLPVLLLVLTSLEF